MKLEYQVTEQDQTINQILKNKLHISSRLMNKLISNKLVKVNNSPCDTRFIVNVGDLISIDLSYEEDNSNIIACNEPIEIIYEDDWLLVLNKPKGIATHPSTLHFDDSLSNRVKFYFDSISLRKKIRPVNRLDLNTSGLIIFAKNEYIQECLINQMQTHEFTKEYIALVHGILDDKKGVIDKPISRKDGSIIERCISSSGKRAVTRYEVLSEHDNYSLVKCKLETGRTHQIRVHFASIGHSLVGDTLYGSNKEIDGHILICYKLGFIHPVSNKKISFELKDTINILQKLTMV